MNLAAVPWGEETAKAVGNFRNDAADGIEAYRRPGIGALAPAPAELIRAYAEVKLAALEGIQEIESYFDPEVMEALRAASARIIAGEENSAFPLPLAQGGAGTSFHMNLVEVLAHRVHEITGRSPDAIEDLARYQSTNDTFATAVVVAAYRSVEQTEAETVLLQENLVSLELRYDGVLMTGRTELQDALPMRAGTLFGAWAGGVERDRWRLSKVAERVREVPLGGTAMGTGFGAPRTYVHAAERHLRRITRLPLSRSRNMMDGVALKDALAEVAGAMRLAALNIAKMAGDMLYYCSSPVGEFIHPDLQYGSSMMPLKTNPVLLERCRGLALSAMGEAEKVDHFAGEGVLQLNAFLPFLIRSLLSMAEECRLANRDFRRFLSGMTPDERRMESHLSRSSAILNALMPLVGYRAMKALGPLIGVQAPETLRELGTLVSGETGIPREKIDEALEPARLTGPPKDV